MCVCVFFAGDYVGLKNKTKTKKRDARTRVLLFYLSRATFTSARNPAAAILYTDTCFVGAASSSDCHGPAAAPKLRVET